MRREPLSRCYRRKFRSLGMVPRARPWSFLYNNEQLERRALAHWRLPALGQRSLALPCEEPLSETLIQMLAAEYLEDCGIKVDTAGSAAEALNKLRLIPGGVDALVVDMGLPDRNGDALVREVRSI